MTTLNQRLWRIRNRTANAWFRFKHITWRESLIYKGIRAFSHWFRRYELQLLWLYVVLDTIGDIFRAY